MRLVKSVLILALTAFWALAVNHCLLEAVAELDLLACSPFSSSTPAEDTHDHEPKDCEGDGCEALEDGFYKASKTYVSVGQSIQGLGLRLGLYTVDSKSDPLLESAFRNSATTAPIPIGLAARWRFSTRAAPSPRAPNLDS